jgi:hypothetical protein
MLMHCFSCLSGPGAVFMNSTPGHVTLNFCFCIWWDLWDTLCFPVRPGHETLTHYFSCLSGPGAVSKKCAPGHDGDP